MRISRLSIEAFRGIPGELIVDLRASENAAPSSLILLGDNGSGKSSIVDALEFALRATLLRRLGLSQTHKKRAQSLTATVAPYVEVEFDDGSVIARGAPGSGRFISPVHRLLDDPHPAFAVTPFVLRRTDIQGFWSLAPSERLLVFFGWFHDPNVGIEQVRAQFNADDAREKAERSRSWLDSTRARLSQLTGVTSARIPTKPGVSQNSLWRNTLSALVTRRKDRTASKAERARARDIFAAWQDYQAACGTHARDAKAVAQVIDIHGEIRGILADASASVTEAFHAISTAEYVSSVALGTGEGSELRVELALIDGEVCVDPVSVLSEANLDLLALLVFVSVLRAAELRGQAPVLVLDDVFQSVDSVFRDRAWQHLADVLADWQLFVITHDRLWAAVIADVLRQRGHHFIAREIVDWSLERGPVLRDARLDPSRALRRASEDADPVTMCSAAGLLLEEISDRLSWTLPASVTRRRGDRYTLGDTWPPIAKRLKRTNLAADAAAVAGSMVLRNLVGAHYNEWARAVSLDEARRFSIAVIALFESVHCTACDGWIAPAGTERWSCRCGTTVVARPEPTADGAAA
jgi:hypothetical protein